MNNIILIGMPGCGKSTVGVLLAKILGYAFIDSDLLIQAKEGKKLYQIINENGEEYFKSAENSVNASISATSTVIATGGSVIYCDEAMQHLKSIGTVVYIKITPEQLLNRINNIATRGVVIKKGETLLDLYKERSPLYEKYADITVEGSDGGILENAESIAKIIEKER